MTFVPKVGAFYRTRDGSKKGPLTRNTDSYSVVHYPYRCDDLYVRSDGTVNMGTGYKPSSDLVEEWPETSPVRTVTRKEIVPGTYGIVNVATAPGRAATWIENRFYSPDEIRAAAATLIEIADALGDTK